MINCFNQLEEQKKTQDKWCQEEEESDSDEGEEEGHRNERSEVLAFVHVSCVSDGSSKSNLKSFKGMIRKSGRGVQGMYAH